MTYRSNITDVFDFYHKITIWFIPQINTFLISIICILQKFQYFSSMIAFYIPFLNVIFGYQFISFL